MRQSQSAVLERGRILEQELATEPFEVAWAAEARWFVHFLDPAESVQASLQVQISPDGINWIDHDLPIEVAASGFVSIPVERFGHWLRLRTTRISGDDAVTMRIYLELKE